MLNKDQIKLDNQNKALRLDMLEAANRLAIALKYSDISLDNYSWLKSRLQEFCSAEDRWLDNPSLKA